MRASDSVGNARAFVLELDLDLVAPRRRVRMVRRAAAVHGLQRVRGEAQEHLAELALVERDRGQRGVELGDEPAGGEARLVREQLDGLLDQPVEVGRTSGGCPARARTAAGCR